MRDWSGRVLTFALGNVNMTRVNFDFENLDWELLLWFAGTRMVPLHVNWTAQREIERRAGSLEKALEIMKERVALGVPIGELPDWKPTQANQRDANIDPG